MKTKTPMLIEAVNVYVRDLEVRGCSPAHTKTVAYRLSRFARDRMDTPLRAAAADLDSYFRELRESGLASGTLAGHKSTHLAFWKWCAGKRLCPARVADVLRSRSHRYSFRPVHSRAANAADFATVTACLPAFVAHRNRNPRDVRDATLASMVIDSSCRRGVLWNLRRSTALAALDRPEQTANGRHVYHAESEGKTGPDTIRFYDESADLLRCWLELIPADAAYVFVNLRTGRRLRPDAMHLGLLRICEYAGVRPFRFHAIRKRVVTEVIAATGDMKVGQLLAGHTDARTTQTYYNDVEQAAVDAAAGALADRLRAGRRLAEAFFGK